jgi:hypothetical protein
MSAPFNQQLAKIPIGEYYPLIETLIAINADVTIILLGRTLQNDNMDVKPLTLASKELTDGQSRLLLKFS